MIIEIFQFFKTLAEGIFYYLPFHLIFFVVVPLIVRWKRAQKYFTAHSLDRKAIRVSVVIPEYNEDLQIFEKCLQSVVSNFPDEIIIVYDDGRREIEDLARKYGAKIYRFPQRVGKRRALVKGWEIASGDIIVQIDSDVILSENAINEIVKPFSDEMVVGVQGKNVACMTKSWFSWRMSQLIEINRDMNNRALNGHLVVIDGRFNAWRRMWLLKQIHPFLNEYFLGKKCEIGDDRFLTWKANLEGYKTVYQSTAIAQTMSPRSYVGFIKQQLRWARSGYKAFFKDITSGLWKKVSLSYNLLQICYYLGPLSFSLSVIHDTLLVPPIFLLPVWAVVPIAIFGSAIIAIIRRFAVGFYSLTLKEFVLYGVWSLFVGFPLMLYALFTVRNQAQWGTR